MNKLTNGDKRDRAKAGKFVWMLPVGVAAIIASFQISAGDGVRGAMLIAGLGMFVVGCFSNARKNLAREEDPKMRRQAEFNAEALAQKLNARDRRA